jgi:hypothetical protein
MGDASDLVTGGWVQDSDRAAISGVAPLLVDEELSVGVGHVVSLGLAIAGYGDARTRPKAPDDRLQGGAAVKAAQGVAHERLHATESVSAT